MECVQNNLTLQMFKLLHSHFYIILKIIDLALSRRNLVSLQANIDFGKLFVR
jgi:hypothetical protein